MGLGEGDWGGEAGELDLKNVSRILALGGSTCRVLRGSEALGGRPSNEAVRWSRFAKEDPNVRGVRGGGGAAGELDLMNVSRILAPGGTFCCVLRGSEALWGLNIAGP